MRCIDNRHYFLFNGMLLVLCTHFESTIVGIGLMCFTHALSVTGKRGADAKCIRYHETRFQTLKQGDHLSQGDSC